MAYKAVQLGTISSHKVFTTLSKWYNLTICDHSARHIIEGNSHSSKRTVSEKVSGSALWDRVVFALSARCNAADIDGVLGFSDKKKTLSLEEASYYREAIVALRLAKEVIQLQHSSRGNAIQHLNRTSGFSRSLAIEFVY